MEAAKSLIDVGAGSRRAATLAEAETAHAPLAPAVPPVTVRAAEADVLAAPVASAVPVAAAPVEEAKTVSGIAAVTAPILMGNEVLPLALTAPLAHLFKIATPSAPDQNADDTNLFVTGTLVHTDEVTGAEEVVPVEVRERGNTSAVTEPFKKLKIAVVKPTDAPKAVEAGNPDPVVGQHPAAANDDGAVAAAEPKGTSIVDHAETFKIGCHGSNDGTATDRYGRYLNEHATWREAFVYALLEAVGVDSLRARPAEITYTDTTTDPPQVLTKKALILEDPHHFSKRLGGKQLGPGEAEELYKTNANPFPADNMLANSLAEVMIGNPDEIDPSRQRPKGWNVLEYKLKDGSYRLVTYDFDLAWLVDGTIHPQWRKSKDQMKALIQNDVARYPDAATAVLARYLKQASVALELAKTYPLDDPGRVNIQGHLSDFFAALQEVAAARQ
jgi:hypothetical protein